MFSLDKKQCRLINCNPRAEKHGDEDVPALDMKLAVEMSNDVLAEFAPDLKWSLYSKDENPSQELFVDDEHRPVLRYPKMGTIAWDLELSNVDLTIAWGIADVTLHGVTVNKFRLECKDGGTVVVTFRAQASDVGEHDLGRLCSLINKDVDVTLEVVEKPEAANDDERHPQLPEVA